MRGERPGRRHGRRRHHLARKLLVMILAAFVLAGLLSTGVLSITRDENESAPFVVQRHVQRRLARVWDDERATQAEVDALRETTGLDARVVRDPSRLPEPHRLRGGAVVLEEGAMFFPIQRGPVVVGALEIRGLHPKPRPRRLLLALGCVLVALVVVARHTARRIAWPLERVADAADRFGGGDLAARAGLDALPRRWLSDEVHGVGVAFDSMAERIERTVRDQRELLAAISHELRSPLGRARRGYEHLRSPSDADRLERLDRLDRELATVDAILGDLLAAARAGLTDLRTEHVTVAPFVRELVATFAEHHPEVELVVEGDERTTVALDRGLFGRAVANVLGNADAHGGREGVVTVRLDLHDGGLALSVEDEGPGFPDDLLPRLFDPFVRGGDPARTPGAPARSSAVPAGGLGLGLTLVRRIVEAHGGTVEAENHVVDGVRRGARVRLRLARAAAKAVA